MFAHDNLDIIENAFETKLHLLYDGLIVITSEFFVSGAKLKILLTRSLKQSQELAKELAALNHHPIISPLLEISYNNEKIPDPNLFDALIITSRNALESIISFNKRIKLMVMGRQTFEFAKALGFTNTVYIGQNIAELRSALNRRQSLLYLSGEDVTDDLSDFNNITRQIVYTAKLVDEVGEDFVDFFQDKQLKIVMLFSFRTAENFSYLVNKYSLNLYCDKIIVLALSDKILQPLKNIDFKAYYIAANPELQDMINLIDRVVNDHKQKNTRTDKKNK
jgi:uroporphyrinogen-III synthase